MKGLLKSKTRKILLVVAVIVIVVLSGSGWLVSLFLDLESARKGIADEMGRKMGRPVKIGGLSVGFFSATMQNVSIGDRQGFGEEPFITVYKASASVRPLDLFRGHLSIAQIKARRPVLVVKRSADGELNVADLLHLDKSSSSKSSKPSSEKRRKRWSGFHTVNVEKITLSRATIEFVDQASGHNTTIPNVDVYCEGDLGSNPIQVTLARIGFRGLSIRMAGEVSRDLKRGWLKLHLQQVDLMAFKEYLPFLSGFETGRWLLQNVSVNGEINNAVLDIKSFTCRPSGGSFDAAGKLWIEHGKPFFELNAKAEGVQLDPFLWQTRTDKISFGGVASGTFSVSGKGVTPEDTRSELKGTAEVIVTDGRFQNKVFIKIGEIAKKVFRARHFDEYRASEARGHFQIGDGRINSSDLRFDSRNLVDIYLAGPGYLTMDGDLNLPRVMLSAGDEQDALQVPIRIKGHINKPKVDWDWKPLRKSLIGE